MTQPDKWRAKAEMLLSVFSDHRQTDVFVVADALRSAYAQGERAREHAKERLEVALHKIITRAAPYPGDTDADRKRDLHHILSIAKDAIRAAKETKE